MRVLYVTGACLTKNTSANMSHNSYLQGLIENGAMVEVVMAKDGWGSEDNKLPKFKDITYYEYESVSWADRLRSFVRKFFPIGDSHKSTTPSSQGNSSKKATASNIKRRKSLRDYVKSLFYILFNPDPVYPIHSVWLKNAQRFKSNTLYDLVISNSSPAASHKLVTLLKEKGQIHYKKWIQIWEDPWYYDLYGGRSEAIKQEEHALLQQAEEIYYVSPLTLHYQKRYFHDCAEKMRSIPLPYLKFGEGRFTESSDVSFGYFGDYYSYTRNLEPFYKALLTLNCKGYIYGDSNLNLQGTDIITVSGRITLDDLEKIQEQTSVLVHLCNLKGGQIPGKIYHYSATEKPILFILDGTKEEKEVLKNYFSQFNRYCFCENNQDSIRKAMTYIIDNYPKMKGCAVEEFSPKVIVSNLIN